MRIALALPVHRNRTLKLVIYQLSLRTTAFSAIKPRCSGTNPTKADPSRSFPMWLYTYICISSTMHFIRTLFFTALGIYATAASASTLPDIPRAASEASDVQCSQVGEPCLAA